MANCNSWLIRAGTLALGVALASCGGGGGGSTEPAIDFWSKSGLVVADFNGDGRDDVAVIDTHVNHAPPHDTVVDVYLQSGAGMSAPVSYPAVADGWTLAAADMDGNGRVDLIATSIATLPIDIDQPSNSGAVSVLLADAQSPGRFAAARTLSSGGHPLESAVIRISGNLFPSLVQALPSGGLLLFRQVGPAEFAAPAGIGAAAGIVASHFAVADLDGDGIQDLAVTTTSSVYWLKQSMDGSFGVPQLVGGGGISLSSIAAADIDGDGRIDLVATDAGNSSQGGTGGSAVMVFLQSGRSFSSQRIPVPDGAQHLAIGDLDMDWVPDLVVISLFYQSTSAWHGVTVLRQSASIRGTFPRYEMYTGPFAGNFVGIADVNGDGRNDIVLNDGPSAFLQSASAPGTFAPYQPLR